MPNARSARLENIHLVSMAYQVNGVARALHMLLRAACPGPAECLVHTR